jgi:hypothetical protein
VQAGRVALRRRFQRGTLIIRGKKPTRCGIYREDVLQANETFKRVQRDAVENRSARIEQFAVN